MHYDGKDSVRVTVDFTRVNAVEYHLLSNWHHSKDKHEEFGLETQKMVGSYIIKQLNFAVMYSGKMFIRHLFRSRE